MTKNCVKITIFSLLIVLQIYNLKAMELDSPDIPYSPTTKDIKPTFLSLKFKNKNNHLFEVTLCYVNDITRSLIDHKQRSKEIIIPNPDEKITFFARLQSTSYFSSSDIDNNSCTHARNIKVFPGETYLILTNNANNNFIANNLYNEQGNVVAQNPELRTHIIQGFYTDPTIYKQAQIFKEIITSSKDVPLAKKDELLEVIQQLEQQGIIQDGECFDKNKVREKCKSHSNDTMQTD